MSVSGGRGGRSDWLVQRLNWPFTVASCIYGDTAVSYSMQLI